MRNPILLFVFSFLMFATSCEEEDKATGLPGYSGGYGEIIVVSSDVSWKGAPGDEIEKHLGAFQHGLPQEEPFFKLVHMNDRNFSRIFQGHRNLLFASVSPDFTIPDIQIEKSVWSNGQLVIKAQASNTVALATLLRENGDRIRKAYQEEETARLITRHKKQGNRQLGNSFLEKHKLSMVLSKDAELAHDGDNMIWIRVERSRALGGYEHQVSQGLVISYEDYQDTAAFNEAYILAQKDTITKYLVPGEFEDSYMTTVYDPIAPESEKSEFLGEFALEIRGLWKMENAFMGGPFFSLTTFDKKNSRVVTAQGYVFAPQFNKREYLREVEAMIRSIKFK